MREPDAVAQRRPAVTDEIGDHRCLSAAAADDHVAAPLHGLFLQRRVNGTRSDNGKPVLIVDLDLIHSLEIYE